VATEQVELSSFNIGFIVDHELESGLYFSTELRRLLPLCPPITYKWSSNAADEWRYRASIMSATCMANMNTSHAE